MHCICGRQMSLKLRNVYINENKKRNIKNKFSTSSSEAMWICSHFTHRKRKSSAYIRTKTLTHRPTEKKCVSLKENRDDKRNMSKLHFESRLQMPNIHFSFFGCAFSSTLNLYDCTIQLETINKYVRGMLDELNWAVPQNYLSCYHLTHTFHYDRQNKKTKNE